MEVKLKVPQEVASAQRADIGGIETELVMASQAWLDRRDAVLRAGGELGWRVVRNDSDKPVRRLGLECPNVEANQRFDALNNRMNELLDQYFAMKAATVSEGVPNAA